MASPPTKKVRIEDGASVNNAYDGPPLEIKSVNSIRSLSADLPNAASSGHPGAPMGCAPMAHLLWSEVMTYSPSNPDWWNRDRFVLSNGHACALQYVMLHLSGYGITIDDLKGFRKLDSITPGHPESFVTPGVEVCTGPLGQGISNAVGLAIAERHYAANYNTPDFPSLFDNRTYVICGDGCLQEGVSAEASSLAGHLGLGKLIVLYDDNLITIDGPTDLSFTEDVNKRYEAYGWHVQTVSDVANSLSDLRSAVKAAEECTDRPSLIKIRTVIGYGSKNEGSSKTHGAPLGAEDLANARSRFGLDPERTFHVDDDVRDAYGARTEAVEGKRAEWDAMFAEYTEAEPEKAAELVRRMKGELPVDVVDALPSYMAGTDKDVATRKHSETALNSVAPLLPELMGGSADLTPSNLTSLKCSGDFQKDTPKGRYLRFGVREHGMVAVCNGMFAYGGLRPFCATFFNFAGYAMGSIRLSALSRFGIIYIMTHDSIGLGEDGPTHQPVEALEGLRAMPNINVVRPADGNEVKAAYRLALQSRETPTVICCSRSTVKGLVGSTVEKAMKGGYVVIGEDAEADLILIGTGTELGMCVDAVASLKESGIVARVVSIPCQEQFLAQTEEYRSSVLPGTVPTLSVEASSAHGWHRFSHGQICMDRFGASGTGGDLFDRFGFTPADIADKGRQLVEFYKGKAVPDLACRPVFSNHKSVEGGH